MPVLWTVTWGHNLMSQTKKHCEPLVAVWLRPSTTEPCICCKQVAEKPRGEHLKNDVCMMYDTSRCNYRGYLCISSSCWSSTVFVIDRYKFVKNLIFNISIICRLKTPFLLEPLAPFLYFKQWTMRCENIHNTLQLSVRSRVFHKGTASLTTKSFSRKSSETKKAQPQMNNCDLGLRSLFPHSSRC